MRRPDWIDDSLYPFADRWLEVDGAVMHYVDEGHGVPLVMLHGNPTWSFLYRDVIRALSPDFRCVAVDLAGFGLSRAPAEFGFRAAEHAHLVARVIAELELDGYIVMGQDWGGPIGLAAAGRAPERVTGVLLGNTWAWSMAGRVPAHIWSLTIGGIPGRWVVERLNLFARVAMRLMPEQRRLEQGLLEHYTRPFPTPASRKPTWVFAQEVTAADEFFRAEVEPAVRALADRPALIPWGERDPVFTSGDRDRLAALFADATVHPLRGAGHFIQEDAPDEIATAIRAWWA
jgi:haloalkane dehalogenase